MGGRGASSGRGHSTSGGGRTIQFHDVTQRFKGMNVHDFENAIRDYKTEYAGVFDKNGVLIQAVTSGKQGSTAIPPSVSTASTLTHNHPYHGDRRVGGTFSEADITILGKYSNLDSMRVSTNGVHENTYIMRKGQNANPVKLKVVAEKSRNGGRGSMRDIGEKALAKHAANMKKKGYSDVEIANKKKQLYLGPMKQYWKTNAEKAGYEYIEVKTAHW